MPTDEVNLRVAAKALIFDDAGKLLLLREAETYKEGTQIGKWGLPGGRLEADEPFMESLAREVAEECGLQIEPGRPVHVDEWWPVIRGVKTHIVGMFIACTPAGGIIRLSDEHDAYEWIKPEEHSKYPMIDTQARAIEAWISANA